MSTHEVEQLLPCMTSGVTLFQFQNTTNYAAHLAVSATYIAAYRLAETSRGDLIIYDSHSKELKYQSVDKYHLVTFLENGDLLAASYHQLIRYKIEDGTAVHL